MPFLTPDIIAKQALATLKETLVMKPLVHTDLTREFSAQKIGDTINIRKPATFVAKDFDRSQGIQLQTPSEESVPLKLDQFKDVSAGLTSEELALDIESFDEQILTPAMDAIALAIDTSILGVRKDVTAAVGQANGFEYDKPEVLLDAGRVLDENLVPSDGRYAVIGSVAKRDWQNTDTLKKFMNAGDTEALRRASLGTDLFGFNPYWTNNIKGPKPAGEQQVGDPTTEVGLAFHSSAIAFGSAPLQVAPGAESYVATDQGVSIRVTLDYDVVKKQTIMSVDTLYGVKLLDPKRAVLIKGADKA